MVRKEVAGSSLAEGSSRNACYSPFSAVARRVRAAALGSAGYPGGNAPSRTAFLASRIPSSTANVGLREASHSASSRLKNANRSAPRARNRPRSLHGERLVGAPVEEIEMAKLGVGENAGRAARRGGRNASPS